MNGSGGMGLAARWSRSVPSLRETALRVGFLRAELMTRDPLDVAAALDVLAGRAEQADSVAREVLGAVVVTLADPATATVNQALRAAATEHGWLALARLLRTRARRRDGGVDRGHDLDRPPDPDDRPLPRGGVAAGARPLTLGERKSLARRPTRAALDRLLSDPHPAVIRNVLVNPRLTEDDVVRLAAKRPAFPDVLLEIARHPGWSQRIRVRQALVHNPYSPPELSVPLVRLLIRPELRVIIASIGVPPIVRAAAKELLDRRPPVRQGGSNTRH